MSTLLSSSTSSSSSSFLFHSSHRPLSRSRSLILYNTIPMISSRFNAASNCEVVLSNQFFIYIFSNVGWFHLCLFDIHRELKFSNFLFIIYIFEGKEIFSSTRFWVNYPAESNSRICRKCDELCVQIVPIVNYHIRKSLIIFCWYFFKLWCWCNSYFFLYIL